MLAHGFTPEMMVEMIRDGLATASGERVVADSRKIEATDAGGGRGQNRMHAG
jgi:hypothetical protein